MTASLQTSPLEALFESDETAWLDSMAEIIAQGRLTEIDQKHLAEYLSDMAKRDRREVNSRLAVLLAHLLKWHHQPAQRTDSWRVTIERERQELLDILEAGTLRNHAEESFERSYEKAVRQVIAETRLARDNFPAMSPWTLDEALTGQIDDE